MPVAAAVALATLDADLRRRGESGRGVRRAGLAAAAEASNASVPAIRQDYIGARTIAASMNTVSAGR